MAAPAAGRLSQLRGTASGRGRWKIAAPQAQWRAADTSRRRRNVAIESALPPTDTARRRRNAASGWG
eukprot:2289637-Alexandrium_andersonii.AAC.1